MWRGYNTLLRGLSRLRRTEGGLFKNSPSAAGNFRGARGVGRQVVISGPDRLEPHEIPTGWVSRSQRWIHRKPNPECISQEFLGQIGITR